MTQIGNVCKMHTWATVCPIKLWGGGVSQLCFQSASLAQSRKKRKNSDCSCEHTHDEYHKTRLNVESLQLNHSGEDNVFKCPIMFSRMCWFSSFSLPDSFSEVITTGQHMDVTRHESIDFSGLTCCRNLHVNNTTRAELFLRFLCRHVLLWCPSNV